MKTHILDDEPCCVQAAADAAQATADINDDIPF
jgi:hypothetical protein